MVVFIISNDLCYNHFSCKYLCWWVFFGQLLIIIVPHYLSIIHFTATDEVTIEAVFLLRSALFRRAEILSGVNGFTFYYLLLFFLVRITIHHESVNGYVMPNSCEWFHRNLLLNALDLLFITFALKTPNSIVIRGWLRLVLKVADI